jgi:hypothetical protein
MNSLLASRFKHFAVSTRASTEHHKSKHRTPQEQVQNTTRASTEHHKSKHRTPQEQAQNTPKKVKSNKFFVGEISPLCIFSD